MAVVAVALTVMFVFGEIASLVLLQLTAARATRRPRRLEVRDGTFIVPPHRPTYALRIVATVVGAGLMASLALLGRPGGGTAVLGAGIVGCAVLTALLVVRSRQPALIIEAAGLRRGRRAVTWAALTERRAPNWVPVSYRSGRTTVEAYATDPRYVMAVIDYYRRTPDARPRIGDPMELRRL